MLISMTDKKSTLLMEYPELAADLMIAFMDMTDREILYSSILVN